jgi:hypothetical protein
MLNEILAKKGKAISIVPYPVDGFVRIFFCVDDDDVYYIDISSNRMLDLIDFTLFQLLPTDEEKSNETN